MLGRCLRLLELIPEWKPRVSEMAALSHSWAALVAVWERIAKELANETAPNFPRYGRAPKTYALMRAALETAESADGWVHFGKGAKIKVGG